MTLFHWHVKVELWDLATAEKFLELPQWSSGSLAPSTKPRGLISIRYGNFRYFLFEGTTLLLL